MELREPIETINYYLNKEYGLAFNSQPNFRVIFSEDQYEKRWTNYTDEGMELLFPEVRNLPKYKQWIKEKYILERLIPIIGETDLTVEFGYEPAWVFQDKNGNYLPPWLDGCRYIIDAILSAAGRSTGHAKYKDPNASAEGRMQQLLKVEAELFGNETDVGDALAYDSGITVPDFKIDESKQTEDKTPVETKQEKDEVH